MKINKGKLKKIKIKSIGFKIFMFIIPIMIFGNISLTMFSFMKTKGEILNLSENYLMQIGKDTAQIVQSEIKTNAQKSEDIVTYISLKNITDKNEILDILKEKMEGENFKSMGFADMSGTYTDIDGNTADISETEHFKMAASGTRAASELYISPIDGKVEVAYAAPLTINDEIFGVVLCIKDGLEYSNITNSMEIGQDGFAFILDRATGQILAAPDNKVIENLTKVDDLVSQDKKYESFKKATDDMINNIQGTTKYELDGKNKIVIHTGILSDYWVVGIVVDENTILDGAKTFRTKLLIFAGILIVSTIVVVRLVSKNISKAVEEIEENINEISKGNFSKEIDSSLIDRSDEFGEIAKDLEKININLSSMISNLKNVSVNVDSSAEKLNSISETLNSNNENISAAINDVAQGNSSQTKNLSSITNKLDSFNHLLNDMKECIESIAGISDEISTNAETSNADMKLVTESIEELINKFQLFTDMIKGMGNKFNGITNITSLIQEISEKTNLLSLNASIESARAGIAGKGFSVVAEEIGKLALESSNATKKINDEIKTMLDEINLLIKESKDMNEFIEKEDESINKAIVSFENISSSVCKIKPMIDDVTERSIKIDKDKQQILLDVDELLAISEEVTASSEEIASTTEEVKLLSNEVSTSSVTLVKSTGDMKEQLDKFKVQKQ